MRARVKLMVVMDYRDYPRDEQVLGMSIQLGGSINTNFAYIVMTSDIDIAPGDEHPVWRVNEVNAFSVNQTVQPFQGSNGADPRLQDNPAYRYQQCRNDGQVEEAIRRSVGRLELKTTRKLTYYIFNYILVQAMLVGLGFTCFTLNRGATDTRLTIAMGLGERPLEFGALSPHAPTTSHACTPL